MDAQFEHLCRVCAANTKSKNNSVIESVFIFKTVGLKDKIARHLFLNVSEHDPLPKVLCKACYRQVEATASLSNIAKHTQRVFRDFLLSTVPKNAREATAALLNPQAMPPAPMQNSNSHAAAGHGPEQRRSHAENDEFRPIVLTRAPQTTVTLAPPQTGGNQGRDELVISLSKKDQEAQLQHQHQHQQHHQQQHQQAQQRLAAVSGNSHGLNVDMSNLMLPPRRNSVFVDTRYGSAPMSIAQRSMQMPPSLTPLHPEVTLSKATKSPEKKPSPAGVINFIQTHGRITGNAPLSISSSGSGSGGSKSGGSSNTAPASAPAISSIGVPNLPSSVLQQKRRNLKNALNNIKAIHSGQVSLLKTSQQRQQADETRPLVTTTVVPHKSLFGNEPSVEEALPEHIIIAAPKKKKEEPSPAGRAGPPKLQKIVAGSAKPPLTPSPPAAPLPQAGKEHKSKMPPSMSSLTESILLGNVIRDPDLLKLILKALKWPVTAGNCEEQMTRLKNSKFAVIMSDSNLLQDNDLTQLLGPYVGPVLAVAQQQAAAAAAANTTPSPAASPPQEVPDLASAMTYKLPPETSVQLVPSSPTETEPPQPLPNVSKRSQRKSRAPDVSSLVISEEQAASTSNAAHVTNELLNINALFISQFGPNPADALNEALISMLKQQQETKSRRQSRRRRSASTASIGLNLEDIVLVEPQPSLVPSPGPAEAPASAPELVGFKLPSQKTPEPPPPITRPIIKRRKTVIQTSKQREAADAAKEAPPPAPPSTPKPREDRSETTASTPSLAVEQLPSADELQSPKAADECASEKQKSETPQAPTSTVPETTNSTSSASNSAEPALDSGAAASTSAAGAGGDKSAAPNARKSGVKSALGQKLLEAIGLQQMGKDVPESARDTLRSVLKRSLKQAQEQQQQLKRVKLEEPVKQLADSTTKPGAGESAEEHKKAIAERELALLKRKTKSGDLDKLPLKDEKSERTDVSSSSSRNRRNRKLKTDPSEGGDSAAEEKRSERWDDDDDLPLKTEPDKSPERGSSSGGASNIARPTRTSKTMSKYYKNPGGEKLLASQKSQHAMGTRSTRQR